MSFDQRIKEDAAEDRFVLGNLLPRFGLSRADINKFLTSLDQMDQGKVPTNKVMMQKIGDITKEMLQRLINNRNALNVVKNTKSI